MPRNHQPSKEEEERDRREERGKRSGKEKKKGEGKEKEKGKEETWSTTPSTGWIRFSVPDGAKHHRFWVRVHQVIQLEIHH